MTIKILLPFVAITVGVFGAEVQSAISNKMDEVREQLGQRRRELQQQGPLSKEEAEYLKTLINKRVLRITKANEDRRFATDAITASNPFEKAINKGRKPRFDKPNKTVGRLTNERGVSSTPIDRDLSGTQRKGSKKSGSNKSGGPG
jgi:uncharacterized membrane-anchored protein YhcB (DUF1043 family)